MSSSMLLRTPTPGSHMRTIRPCSDSADTAANGYVTRAAARAASTISRVVPRSLAPAAVTDSAGVPLHASHPPGIPSPAGSGRASHQAKVHRSTRRQTSWPWWRHYYMLYDAEAARANLAPPIGPPPPCFFVFFFVVSLVVFFVAFCFL